MDSAKGIGGKPLETNEPGQPVAAPEKVEDPAVWEGHELEKPTSATPASLKQPDTATEEATPPVDTATSLRSVSAIPDFNMFPEKCDELIEVMVDLATQPCSPLLKLKDKTLRRYKEQAKQQSMRRDNDFAAALGRVSTIGHLLLELQALKGDSLEARIEFIKVIAGGAMRNSPERTTAQLRCWYAQKKLADAVSLDYRDKHQIVLALREANKKVVPMAAWLLAVIHAGLQEGMEEFADVLQVNQNLAEASAQFENHFAGDPVRFSKRQLLPMEADPVLLPEANDKSDSSVCFYFQNMLRGMYGVGCKQQSVPGISVDLVAPMKAVAVMMGQIYGYIRDPQKTFGKNDRNYFSQIKRLSRSTSPRLSAR